MNPKGGIEERRATLDVVFDTLNKLDLADIGTHTASSGFMENEWKQWQSEAGDTDPIPVRGNRKFVGAQVKL